ncbi:helix-turn-helix DNA binding protein [Corynebacterium phage PSonyx]|nr:helix-turn-helix DNA binding protein [Corynebacterium phage PSonyx]
MSIIITDTETGAILITTKQITQQLGIARGTFSSYASRNLAPQPVARHQGLALYDQDEVHAWYNKAPLSTTMQNRKNTK